MAYIFDLSDAWAGGAAFTAIKMNVSDGGSTAGSLLMDLQVGGVSKFSISKSGLATIPGDNTAALAIGGLSLGAAPTSARATGILFMRSGSEIQLSALSTFGWSSANNSIGTSDLFLRRDAANTLAQRNGVNAQAFNLYNTYTDASNYERGFMRFVSNVLQIGSEKLGTGTARALAFQTDGVTRMTIGANGGVAINNNSLSISNAHTIDWGSNTSYIFGNATTGAGTSTLRIAGGAGSVTAINFGGDTSSFPTIKRSTTSLQARLADDSAFTNIQGKLTTETAYTAGTIVATGYLTLYDSTGTAYRVPCVV